MTRHWYRKGSSGVPTKVRMPSSAPERKPWPNNGQSQVSRMLDPNISIEAFLLPDYILQNAFSNITYLCHRGQTWLKNSKPSVHHFHGNVSRRRFYPTLGWRHFVNRFLKDIKRYQNIRRQLFRKWLIVNILSKATCNRNYLESTSTRQKSVNSYIAS